MADKACSSKANRAYLRGRGIKATIDQYKALQAWNYWNHLDVVLPFNATMPKGEVGINPAYPALEHVIFRAEKVEDGLVEPVEQLDLSIAPRLVDLRYALMRSPKALVSSKSEGHPRSGAA